jgi:prepilin-type N-terminal cleavage/methylation domain-containing protein
MLKQWFCLSGCKTRFSALPLLTYLKVRCAAVLENRVFRHNIQNHKWCGARGFSLTEISIVLALFGLLLGVIWVTASTVLQNSGVSHAIQQVTETVQNIRDQFANTQNPPGWTAGSDMTATLKGRLLFPAEMTQGASVTHAMGGTFQVVEPTCGTGAAPNTIKLPVSVCPATPNNLVYFRIVLNGLSQTYCTKILEAVPVADTAMGIVQAGVTNGNGCTSTSCVRACTSAPCFFTSSIPIATASGWCDGTANDNTVFVDFKLHN